MKKHLIQGALTIFCGVLFTNCGDKTVEFQSVADDKIQSFDENFKATFGYIAKGHDWGFGSQASVRTRYAQTDGNMWGPSTEPNRSTQPYVVPAPLTQEQKNKVRDWFQTHRNPSGLSLTWTDFFVQQVYKGADSPTTDCPEVYTAKDGQTQVTGSNQMDYLTAGSKNDHINNFNWGSYSYNQENSMLVWDGTMDTNKGNDFNDQKVYHYDQIMLMRQSSTDCFGYWESFIGKQYNDHFVIISGNTIDKDIPSGASVAGMYFVGFDFNADDNTKALSQQVDRDYYFTDWIVRITEGILPSNEGGGTQGGSGASSTTTYKYYETTEFRKHTNVIQGRIICEDLGATTDSENNRRDIDYNDVVFDAYLISERYYTKYIKTVETYVDGIYQDTKDNGSGEVTTSTNNYTKIVLLAAGGTIPLSVAGQEVHNKFGVDVDVMVNTVNQDQSVGGRSVSGRSPVEFTTSYYNSLKEIPIVVRWGTDVIYLEAHEGGSPQKICVPIGTPWCKERSSIDIGYPDFSDWVHNNGSSPWYNRIQNKLYDNVPSISEMPNETDELVSSNSNNSQQSNTSYTVNPASNEKIVWQDLTGNTSFSSWDSNHKISYATLNQNDSNGKSFGVNSIIRAYVSVSNGFNVQMHSENASFQWTKLVEASSGNNDSHIINGNGYIEYKVTQSALNDIKTGNLALNGMNYKLLAVTIDNTNSTAGSSSSQSQPTTPSSTSGKVLYDSSTNGATSTNGGKIYADASEFTNASGKTLRIYCQNPQEGWDVEVRGKSWGNMNITAWKGTDKANANNFPTAWDGGKNYLDIVLTDTQASMLSREGLMIIVYLVYITQVVLI